MAQPGPQDIQYKPLKKIQPPKVPQPGQSQSPKVPQAGQSKVSQPGQSQPPKVTQPGQSKLPNAQQPNHTGKNQKLSDKNDSELTRERIYLILRLIIKKK